VGLDAGTRRDLSPARAAPAPLVIPMEKSTLRNWFTGVFCRPAAQPLFDLLHRLSLTGMNFSGGDRIETSGERQVIRRLLDPRISTAVPIVVDAGANGGAWALEVLRVLGDRVRVCCLEPQGAMFARLSERLARHGNVAVFQIALGANPGKAPMHLDCEASTLGSLFHRDLGAVGRVMDRTESVTVRRLDDFCREQGISHVDLLKLDIEGSEFDALLGAGDLIARGDVGLIQFEFNACAMDARRYFRDFFALLNPNFRIFRILRSGMVELERYSSRHEIFIAANYLAVSRAAREG
jgi:FkbM family methyltransferase